MFVITYSFATSSICPILKIFSGLAVCFTTCIINSLCVLILPMSLSPYSCGYEVPLLLCLKRNNCSALSPSSFCSPAFKCIAKSCDGSS